MQSVLFNFFHAHGLKSAEADVERDFSGFDSSLMDTVEDLGSEMKSGGGGDNGTALASVYGLVTFAIRRRIRAGDVWGQRDVTDFVHAGKEIWRGCEADVAFAEFAAGDDLGLEFVMVAEEKMFSNPDFAAGSHQTLPIVGFALELAGEEDFDAPLEEIAGCGIVKAKRLRMEAGTSSVQAGWKDFRVIEYDQVGGAEEVGEITKCAIVKCTGFGIQVQQAGGSAVGKSLLRDEFFGKVVIEVGNEHRDQL